MTRIRKQPDSTDTLEKKERKETEMYLTIFLLIMSILIINTGPSTIGASVPFFCKMFKVKLAHNTFGPTCETQSLTIRDREKKYGTIPQLTTTANKTFFFTVCRVGKKYVSKHLIYM